VRLVRLYMSSSHTSAARLPALTLGALGIVYGDIGTSPLYTLRESFSPHIGIPVTEANIFGFLLIGMAGAGLFYADGMITPAISVLSAVEGLQVIAPHLDALVVPLTCGLLTGLFMLQRSGTGTIGRWFGPIMVIWFLTLGILGLRQIIAYPAILQAMCPTFAIAFWEQHSSAAFFSLGAVVLAVTGGEALYADMGHFGARAVRVAWLGLVLPAVLLNCFLPGRVTGTVSPRHQQSVL
jgi:KUP system potassium uptake protein